jgi:hypothetical protein
VLQLRRALEALLAGLHRRGVRELGRHGCRWRRGGNGGGFGAGGLGRRRREEGGRQGGGGVAGS